MFDLQEKLSALTEKFLQEEYGVSTTVHFQVPLEEGRGDLTSSIALQLAKKVGKQPLALAEELKGAIGELPDIDSITVAKPGYVNVEIHPRHLVASLSISLDSCEPQQTSSTPPVIIEYSQPNIAKPLGIHHILSTVIGQVLVNVGRHAGEHIIAINHIGDWGTQFGKLAIAYRKWGTEPVEESTIDDLLALYVKFHEEVEKDPLLEGQAREAFSALERGDTDMRSFWRTVVDITMRSMESLYERLHVSFDHVQGESFYQDKMVPVIEEGKRKGVFASGEEGALIATFPEELHLPPAIVLKADGSTIYFTRDLATIRYRIDTWHPKAILYVVDTAQKMHFEQLFHTVKQLEWRLPELTHVVFGRMRFADKAMSTRRGTILKLEEVIDEAVRRADRLIEEKESALSGREREELKEMMGVGSVVYGVLSQNRKMDMVFDWKKVLTFEGNSAPYLQYTHARARSVLRRAEKENVAVPQYEQQLTASERCLIHLLLSFREALKSAREESLPHRLTNYLYELCQAYNTFYNAEQILKADEPQRSLRLALTFVTAEVLKTGAHLLTLRVPDRM